MNTEETKKKGKEQPDPISPENTDIPAVRAMLKELQADIEAEADKKKGNQKPEKT